ncbi:MAG: DUF5050 domain-containing protein [Lachnospiraceae bacterium]|nr:DUF5050 domain-containing protein [Lachnospiraceae bacterium]
MTTRQKNILILSITGVVVILLLLLVIFSGHISFNDENTTGNTAGNLNNGGYFCETEDRVYFANAYDNYALYSMNPDETDLKKLNDNSVSSINAGGNYLYYAMSSNSNGSGLGFVRKTSGIYRSKLNGSGVVCLDRCHIVTMQLCGNYLYYEKYDNTDAVSLDKIKINKKEQQTLAAERINPNCYVNGQIYYQGTEEDHYLHVLNTATDTTDVLWQGDIWNPVYQNGYIYYMDVADNYRLCRYSMSDDIVEVLTNDRIDMFNVYGDYIYYQVSSKDAPALKRMLTDGSSQELVREGVYQNINITSQYVYFNAFNEETPVYKTSTYGPVNVTTFDAGMQAALDNMK